MTYFNKKNILSGIASLGMLLGNSGCPKAEDIVVLNDPTFKGHYTVGPGENLKISLDYRLACDSAGLALVPDMHNPAELGLSTISFEGNTAIYPARLEGLNQAGRVDLNLGMPDVEGTYMIDLGFTCDGHLSDAYWIDVLVNKEFSTPKDNGPVTPPVDNGIGRSDLEKKLIDLACSVKRPVDDLSTSDEDEGRDIALYEVLGGELKEVGVNFFNPDDPINFFHHEINPGKIYVAAAGTSWKGIPTYTLDSELVMGFQPENCYAFIITEVKEDGGKSRATLVVDDGDKIGAEVFE